MNPLDRLDQNGNVIAFVNSSSNDKSNWKMLSGIVLAILVFIIGVCFVLILVYPSLRHRLVKQFSFLIPNFNNESSVGISDDTNDTESTTMPRQKDKLATPSSASDIGNKWCLISDLDRARRCIPVSGLDECQSKYVYGSKNTCELR